MTSVMFATKAAKATGANPRLKDVGLRASRHAYVSREGAPGDGWNYVTRDWEDAFWALARCLFLPAASEPGSIELAPVLFDEEQLEDEVDIPY